MSVSSILSFPQFTQDRIHMLTYPTHNMPRPKKQKLDPSVADPAQFINDYCDRKGLPKEYGASRLEKECHDLAQQAREEFKNVRDGNTQRDVFDRKGLSPAEKYTIRLENNRKSADASKVYHEIFKRQQAYRLASLSESTNTDKTLVLQAQQRSINALQKEIDALKTENTRLNGVIQYEKKRADKFQKQCQQTQQSQYQAHLRSQPIPIHPPLPQSQSQSQPVDTGESLPGNTPSLHQRLVSSRILPQWTLSPGEGETKEFHTGLTQSQTDDPEDKALVRSMPLSAGLPLNLLGSQPSQSDLPTFKSTIGSEDLPMPPETEFFMGSQGTTKGRV